MKNILFPTDFTPQSIKTLELFVKGIEGAKFNIILFAAFETPNSEQDTVGSKPHLTVLNEDFRKGCKKIKEKFADKIGQVQYKYMYGNTRQVFRNYIEFNEIDQILLLDGYHLTKPHAKFIDPVALLNQSPISVIREMPATAAVKNIPAVNESKTASTEYKTVVNENALSAANSI